MDKRWVGLLLGIGLFLLVQICLAAADVAREPLERARNALLTTADLRCRYPASPLPCAGVLVQVPPFGVVWVPPFTSNEVEVVVVTRCMERARSVRVSETRDVIVIHESDDWLPEIQLERDGKAGFRAAVSVGGQVSTASVTIGGDLDYALELSLGRTSATR